MSKEFVALCISRSFRLLITAASTAIAWSAMTARIDVNDIGACANSACDGQFLFDDGTTHYSYGVSGIGLTSTTPGECLRIKTSIEGVPELDDGR